MCKEIGNIPRQEHPKPQFRRNDWLNLNGEWGFAFDFGNSGEARLFHKDKTVYDRVINVPFCPESKLSGIGYTDFMNSVWYRKEVYLTKEQLSKLVYLHFGAVDYVATVFINGIKYETARYNQNSVQLYGKKYGTHIGGYASFRLDITKYLHEGVNEIVVHAEDDMKGAVPHGKQSRNYRSSGADYTRTTGIWQTVWVEFVPEKHIEAIRYYPDVENASVTVKAKLYGEGVFKIKCSFDGKEAGSIAAKSKGGELIVSLPLKEKHLWEIGKGGLYDIELSYGDDVVYSYFGLRNVRLDGHKFMINNKSVFQRLILDQGFYPDGIYTASNDEMLEKDIELSMRMGFNGARLHQKVFEERFLYHCDKKGYIVWGEYPIWGLGSSYQRFDEKVFYSITEEWTEVVERDFNHPSIVGWCVFNEVWGENYYDYADMVRAVYTLTKKMDSTRPVIDVSGGVHTDCTDIFDVHNYEQDPCKFAQFYKDLQEKKTFRYDLSALQRYDGNMPVMISEYGGINYALTESAWSGYGAAPKTKEEFLSKFKGLADAILDNPCIFGFCYTQLTNVEQEQNGLYFYDRTPKFDSRDIYPIISRKAKIEE